MSHEHEEHLCRCSVTRSCKYRHIPSLPGRRADPGGGYCKNATCAPCRFSVLYSASWHQFEEKRVFMTYTCAMLDTSDAACPANRQARPIMTQIRNTHLPDLVVIGIQEASDIAHGLQRAAHAPVNLCLHLLVGQAHPLCARHTVCPAHAAMCSSAMDIKG